MIDINQMREREIIRYLGYKKIQPDEQVMMLIHQCMEDVARTAQPRHIYRRFCTYTSVCRSYAGRWCGAFKQQSGTKLKRLQRSHFLCGNAWSRNRSFDGTLSEIKYHKGSSTSVNGSRGHRVLLQLVSKEY